MICMTCQFCQYRIPRIQENHLDPDVHYRLLDHFPYIITKGDGPLRSRAYHPDFVLDQEIDFDHYVEEALRSVNRFNLNIDIDEIKGISYIELDEFFEKKV